MNMRAVALVVLWVANLLFAQGTEPTQGTKEITVAYDFGKIPMRSEWAGEYDLLNETEDEILVTGIEPSCGCLEASASNLPIPPGEKIPLTLKLDLRNRYGAIKEGVNLTLMQRNEGKVNYWMIHVVIKGEVLQEVLWRPTALVAPELEEGAERFLLADGEFRQLGKWILKVKDEGLPCRVSFKQTGTKVQAIIFLCEKELPPRQDKGTFDIPITLESGEAKIQTYLTIDWSRKTPFVTDPPFLQRQYIETGTKTTVNQLIIRRRDGNAFSILEVETPSWLQVPIEKGNKTTWVLRLLPLESGSDYLAAGIRIRTDDPWLPWVMVPISIPSSQGN